MSKFKYRYVRPYLVGMMIGFGLMIPWSVVVWHLHHLTTALGLAGSIVALIVLLDDFKEDFDRKAGK